MSSKHSVIWYILSVLLLIGSSSILFIKYNNLKDSYGKLVSHYSIKDNRIIAWAKLHKLGHNKEFNPDVINRQRFDSLIQDSSRNYFIMLLSKDQCFPCIEDAVSIISDALENNQNKNVFVLGKYPTLKDLTCKLNQCQWLIENALLVRTFNGFLDSQNIPILIRVDRNLGIRELLGCVDQDLGISAQYTIKSFAFTLDEKLRTNYFIVPEVKDRVLTSAQKAWLSRIQ